MDHLAKCYTPDEGETLREFTRGTLEYLANERPTKHDYTLVVDDLTDEIADRFLEPDKPLSEMLPQYSPADNKEKFLEGLTWAAAALVAIDAQIKNVDDNIDTMYRLIQKLYARAQDLPDDPTPCTR